MPSSEFLLTSLVVALIPGTGVLYTVSSSLFYGFRASMAAALGCTLGILPHLLASVLGLSLILELNAALFQGLKFAGALYLFYLAWTTWRKPGALSFGSASSEESVLPIIVKAISLSLLNPKLTLFFFAFLPLATSPAAVSPLAELLQLSLIFMSITLVVFAGYGALASQVRHQVLHSPKATTWLTRTFAALGLKLALLTR